METLHAPKTAINLTPLFYYQMAYTLISLLPPPLADTPELLYVRDHAAIARVGALKPVNANEADLAAQCVAARAQADDLLRLARLHAADIRLVARLNAQYMSMLRTATAVYKTLMRTQALRIAREKTEGAADQDAWTQHITEDYMMRVINPEHEEIGAARDKRERAEAAKGEAARPAAMQPEAMEAEATQPEAVQPKATQPEAAPAASVEPKISDDVSEYKLDAQDMAFETYLSTFPQHQGSTGADNPGLIATMSEIMTGSQSPVPEVPSTSGEKADPGGNGDTAPA